MCNRPPVSTHKAVPCCGRCTRSHLSIGVIINWSDGLQVFTQISPNAVNFVVSRPACQDWSLCQIARVVQNVWQKSRKVLSLLQQTDLARTKKMVSPASLCSLCLLVLSVAILHSLAIPQLQCIAMEAMEWIGSFLPFQQKTFFLTPSWWRCCSDLWVAPWAPRRRREQRSGRCPPSAIALQHTRGWSG